MLILLERVRRRWHPLHRLRKLTLFRRITSVVDIPVWWHLYGVRHPVRLRLIRNLTYILNSRTNEPEIVALFRAIHKVFSPQTFWDVGAYIGYYSWLHRSQGTSMGVSVLFEPDPINLDLIHQTAWRVGDTSGIVILPYAVSETDGEAVFIADPVSGATGAIKKSSEKTFFCSALWCFRGDDHRKKWSHWIPSGKLRVLLN